MNIKKNESSQLNTGMRINIPQEHTDPIREPSITGAVPTSANTGGEPFLTVRFDNIDDAENAFNILEDKGYEEVVISGIHNETDHFFDSFKDLRDEAEEGKFEFYGLGVKPTDPDHTVRIKELWADTNAVWQNQ